MYIEIKQNIVAFLGYLVWRNGSECCIIAHKMTTATRTRERDWIVVSIYIYKAITYTTGHFQPKNIT